MLLRNSEYLQDKVEHFKGAVARRQQAPSWVLESLRANARLIAGVSGLGIAATAAAATLASTSGGMAAIAGVGCFVSFGVSVALALIRGMPEVDLGPLAEQQPVPLGIEPIATIPLVAAAAQAVQTEVPAAAPTTLARFLPDMVYADRHMANLVLREPKAPFARSIQSLRQSLCDAGLGRAFKVLQVTSALPGEGKSTIAANLARAAALRGESVLLIDADLRRPSLAAKFGLAAWPGLAELLAGSCNTRSVIRRDGRTSLYCIAGDRSVPGTEALTLLSSRALTSLIVTARAAYDLVIVDSGALMPVADPRMLVGQVDAVIMVVSPDAVAQSAARTALQEIPGIENKLLGVVMNRAEGEFDRNSSEYGSLFKVA